MFTATVKWYPTDRGKKRRQEYLGPFVRAGDSEALYAADALQRAVRTVTITFDDHVLRPRLWTMAQARWAAELADTAPPGRLLELCSGVGQIGLATATLCRSRALVMVDADARACSFARVNATTAALGVPVDIRQAPLEDALAPGELFSVIIADPPWVPSSDTARYPEDPLWAIDGGTDGLDVARQCLHVIATHLIPGGSAVLQLGTADQIRALAADLGDELKIVDRQDIPDVNGTLIRLTI